MLEYIRKECFFLFCACAEQSCGPGWLALSLICLEGQDDVHDGWAVGAGDDGAIYRSRRVTAPAASLDPAINRP